MYCIKDFQGTCEKVGELVVQEKPNCFPKTIKKQCFTNKRKFFDVKNINVKDNLDVMRVKNVSFDLKKGEILGIAGVTGNGQTELLEALTGICRVDSGEIKLHGKTISSKKIFAGPRQLREQDVAHVPEDRQRMGLVTEFTASENLIFGYHHQQPFSKSSVMMGKNIFNHSIKVMKDYYLH